MDYAVTATMDWRNVRAWVETAAAVFAAVGTVLAFFAMRRTARAQEATLGVQASQLALQQEQIDNVGFPPQRGGWWLVHYVSGP